MVGKSFDDGQPVFLDLCFISISSNIATLLMNSLSKFGGWGEWGKG